ncbi:2'-5' RNA ligase family protein [Sphingomonas sp. G124]|uniref:2'-5' RNA ligase family protein n=1 Tax=Sphingomonas cremea TaxID=2904799 RepID=A0A9X1QLC2_9SPHN|nr:2'-5' RNA ligase family protein [Sphingomonas cremea]MCF2514257.1 2'-5' RNA ligase family protein [Sphingomonas cremea]
MGALIVTAEFAPDDFAWLEGLRRANYPPELNRVSVHLTLFHALPPSAEEEVRRQLALHATGPAPNAALAGLMDLGGGIAIRVVSEELDSIRNEIADHFHGLLSAQDSAGWRPHVTIQNKVPPKIARALLAKLARDFRPRPLGLAGLALHRYLEGPWETLARYPFRGR